MRVIVKVGGAQLESREGRQVFARSVAAARQAGHEVIVVHGGGAQLKELCARVGLDEVRHEGLRVTCAETSELALAVLGGAVNRKLVLALESETVPAVGLTGADGQSYAAQKHTPGGVDLGYVGELVCVDGTLVETLLAAGYVPVLASMAPLARLAEGDDAHVYNVNADSAAGALATPLGADALLFLTDVPAVRDGDGTELAELDAALTAALTETGALAGGILPKVRAAFAALAEAPEMRIKIAPADGPDAVLEALDGACGTLFVAEQAQTEPSRG